MQKSLLLLPLFVLLCLGVNAQRYADLQIVLNAPKNADTAIAGQPFTIDADIKNLGADTIQTTDSFAFVLSFDGNVISFGMGPGGSMIPYIPLNNRLMAPGDSASVRFTFAFDESVVADTTRLCVEVYNINVVDTLHDTVLTNNISCATFTIRSAADISERANVVNELKVFPNPATDIVNLKLQLNSAEDVSVKLFNIMGQEVAAKHLSNAAGEQVVSFNTASLPKGVYTYTVVAGDDMKRGKLELR